MEKVQYEDNLNDKPLKDLTSYFFNWRQFNIMKNELISGMTGEDHSFDFIISGGKNESPAVGRSIGVMVLDYRKHCGTDSVIKAEKAGKDCDLAKMMVISNGFSSSAQAMAKRAGILTLSRGELVSILRIHGADLFDA
ncbi:MAG: hypothetical protein ACXAEU_10510 [Candidatus Hodarchaeales archaeon]|jgi:hypothetical protein